MADECTVIIPPSACGMRLLDYLCQNGYPITAPCGGNGTCEKCRVTVEKGMFTSSPTTNAAPLLPDENGQIRACRAYCTDKEAQISFLANALVPDTQASSIDVSAFARYSVALDIGTTTLAAALVALPSGVVVGTYTALNPLAAFGADVISRIAAAKNGQLLPMHRHLISATQAMLSYFKNSLCPNGRIETLACVGNTTMLHLFWGISPKSMAEYPFTPTFTDAKAAEGSALSLDVDTVYTLPSATAFFGADAISGIVQTALTKSPTPTVLLDLGTNGELALYTGGKDGCLYVTSTAAGPAFEGAGISSGVGGVRGAVCRVTPRGQSAFSTDTIDGDSPIGICGVGLIDLISALRLQGRLDETGHLPEGTVVYAQGKKGPLSVTQEDIRAFQVAKSAIRAGVDALLAAANIEGSDLTTVLLGGGMGQYLHITQAQHIGLLPTACKEIKGVQNCALDGAVTFLKNGCDVTPFSKAATQCIPTELNDSAVFPSAFMAHMRLDRS